MAIAFPWGAVVAAGIAANNMLRHNEEDRRKREKERRRKEEQEAKSVGTILAIDPGNTQSGYVVVEHDGEEIRRVLEAGKIENPAVTDMLDRKLYANCIDVAIEMIAGMGMTVGQEVFDTCVWVGRFWEIALRSGGYEPKRIYRREEKLYLCGRLSAKDKNIRQALIDRYGVVGTKANPGFFYVNGVKFAKDMWAAMAVAVTYFDKYIKGVKL